MENTPRIEERKDRLFPFISKEELLAHWQVHRGLTRRVIDAFPESEFFSYRIGGMRPFAEMVKELLDLSGPGIEGIMSGDWGDSGEWDHSLANTDIKTKGDILDKWDEITEKIDRLWPEIPPHRFREIDLAFGRYRNPIYSLLFYIIDNEIHHRGQGYVYLRALEIEPPPFWEH